MSSNLNTMHTGVEGAAVASDKGAGGIGQSDAGVQQARNESLPSGPGDHLPNLAINAMRSAQAGGMAEHGAHSMLHNGLSIGDQHGGMGAKSGEAVAIAGGFGAKAIAGGKGASAIAEGPGATAVAEGRDAHAVAEGPGAHAIAEGPGARAVAEDGGMGKPKSDHPLKSDQAVLLGRPPEGFAKGRELPEKLEAKQQGTAQILQSYPTKDH
jgi:hypothetical protein